MPTMGFENVLNITYCGWTKKLPNLKSISHRETHALLRESSRVPRSRKVRGSSCVKHVIQGKISLWLIIAKSNLITETMETDQF
jgi:hypothetical protein